MTCKYPGCSTKVKAKGYCQMHYRQDQKGKLPTPPPTDDDLINQLIGKPIESLPDKPKPEAGPDGKPLPPGSTAPGGKQPMAAPSVPPQMWFIIGSTLNNLLATKAYSIDDETAKYLSDGLAAAMMENKIKPSATGAFISAILMWLGLSTILYLKERAEKDPRSTAPVKNDALQGAKDWLTNLATGRKTKIATQAIQQQVERAPETQYEQVQPEPEPIQVATAPVVQRNATLHPKEQKVQYLDLEAMSQESEKETAKLKMEMWKKKQQKLGQSPGATAP